MSKVFIAVPKVGKLDDKGKIEYAYSFKGRIESEQDTFLNTIIPTVLDHLLDYANHTNFEAAEADLKALQATIASIKLRSTKPLR